MIRIKSTCAEIVVHDQDKVYMRRFSATCRIKSTCADLVLHAQDKVYMRRNSVT